MYSINSLVQASKEAIQGFADLTPQGSVKKTITDLLTENKEPSFQEFADKTSEGSAKWIIQNKGEESVVKVKNTSKRALRSADKGSKLSEKRIQNPTDQAFKKPIRSRLSPQQRDAFYNTLEQRLNNFSQSLQGLINADENNNPKEAFHFAVECEKEIITIDPFNQLVFYSHYFTFLLKNKYLDRAMEQAKKFFKLEETPAFTIKVVTASDYQKTKAFFLTQYVKALIATNALDEAKKTAEMVLNLNNNDSCIGELYFSLASIAFQKSEYTNAFTYLFQGEKFTYDADIGSKYILLKTKILNRMNASALEILKICQDGLQDPNIPESIKDQLLVQQADALFKADAAIPIEEIKKLMPTKGSGPDAFITLNSARKAYNNNEFYATILMLNSKCFLTYIDEEIALKLWLYKCCAHAKLAEQATTSEIKNKHNQVAKYYLNYAMKNFSNSCYEKVKSEVAKELKGFEITQLFIQPTLLTNTIPLTPNIISLPTIEEEPLVRKRKDRT